MACYKPLEGYRAITGGLTWTPAKAYVDQTLRVSCGQCIGCRLERSRQWAVRMMHEASLHESNCFVTLTYDDEHVPDPPSLRKSDFQKFIKRLRKRRPEKIRYFHCGEYGDESRRPHYHAALFGYSFLDRTPWSVRNSHQTYRSQELEELWPHGLSEIGELTFESAAYLARYVTKKITGKRAQEHYQCVNGETGEVFDLEPEYATMSRRPGIGHGWLEKFGDDVYPSDEVIVRGVSCKPPRYYDLWYAENQPEEAEKVFAKRRRDADRENSTPERLQVREVCAEARLNLYSPRTGVE